MEQKKTIWYVQQPTGPTTHLAFKKTHGPRLLNTPHSSYGSLPPGKQWHTILTHKTLEPHDGGGAGLPLSAGPTNTGKAPSAQGT